MGRKTKIGKPSIPDKRGWDALALKLRAQGLREAELEEAHDSFNKGIGLMAKLYLSSRLKTFMKHEQSVNEL